MTRSAESWSNRGAVPVLPIDHNVISAVPILQLRIVSDSAVPSFRAVAYLTIWAALLCP
ncbi:MAG: hypothetical protein NVSMB43_21080 [Pseudarthrobacter sp.]